jgi:formylglycine-generating enzyme required for sulfatase activity
LLQSHDGTFRIDSTDFEIEPGWQRLLTLKLDRQVLLWSVQKAGQTLHYRPWNWMQQPLLSDMLLQSSATPLSHLNAEELWLHTGRQQICLTQLVAPGWAKEWGVDPFGLYADLSFRSVTQRFRWIGPGSFLMGSPVTESSNDLGATQHWVTLTKGFWLADTACTWQLWQVVTGKKPYYFDDMNKPVDQLEWKETQGFLAKINSEIPGLKLRLPTEAEWEYACRAGTESFYCFGNNINPSWVNYSETGINQIDTTVDVKSLPPNAWGLYEMHGNVWEWCHDGWQDDLSGEAVIDPLFDPEECFYRVMRGGGWNDDEFMVRSASRFSDFIQFNHQFYIGFRLALD